MKYFIIIAIAILNFIGLYSQPPMNQNFEKYVKELPDMKKKYLPLLMLHYGPEKMMNLTDAEAKAIVLDSLNYFIADSGRHYDKILDPYKPTQTITPEILVSLKRLGNPVISNDGTKMLFTVNTPNIQENKSNNDIYFQDLSNFGSMPLVFDPKADYEPIWLPDDKSFIFISTRSGAPQIFKSLVDGTNQTQITKIENGVSNIGVSPDGLYYSFTTEVKLDKTPADNYPALNKANVRIYESLPVRHWDEWTDENFSHLIIMPVNGGEPIDIMPNEKFDTPLKPLGGASEICWSPDSKEIAYTSKKVDNYVLSTNSDIYIYDITNKQTRNITEGMVGYDKDPQYSPNGKWIAFHSQERAGFESDRIRLMLYNRESGKITELSRKLDQWVGDFVWSPDSKTIYFSAEDGALVKLYKIEVESGDWKILTNAQMNCDGGIAITKDGSKLLFGGRTMIMPTEIYSVAVNGDEMKKRTFFNDNVLNQIKRMNITERLIKNDDGDNIHTWVLYPPDFDSTKKYPMITYCQGGPQSTISQYFSFRWNLFTFASHGYIVVAPNRRGVPGFGQKWNDAISKDWGGGAMEDILAATDAIAREPYIKKDGLAAIGASAGGYATFWLEGNHKKRFSAFVSHCGVFNVVSKYGSTEELFFPNWEFGGPYWMDKNKKYYEKFSPHMYANNWDTPILISSGEKDFRVPFTQSLEAFTVAQSKGIPSKLIIFPNENHWILKPQEQILWYHEVFEFLDRYCKK
jgi:dipeptidyl aminopeptidase/acylaminoacyl peptidase